MKPLVLHDGFAQLIFWLTFGVGGAFELVLSARTRVPRGASSDRSQTVLTLTVIAAFLLAFGAAREVPDLTLPGPGWWPLAVGLLLAWLGLVLRAWAVWTLGEFFTKTLTVRTDQPVIDAGPYAAVRHPSYTGLLLNTLGIGLALGNALSVVAYFVPTALAFAARVGAEEAMLERELGEAYRSYMQRTSRLVPRVW